MIQRKPNFSAKSSKEQRGSSSLRKTGRGSLERRWGSFSVLFIVCNVIPETERLEKCKVTVSLQVRYIKYLQYARHQVM